MENTGYGKSPDYALYRMFDPMHISSLYAYPDIAVFNIVPVLHYLFSSYVSYLFIVFTIICHYLTILSFIIYTGSLEDLLTFLVISLLFCRNKDY